MACSLKRCTCQVYSYDHMNGGVVTCECVYAYVLVMTMACPLDELYTAWNEKWLLTPRSNAISQKRKNKQTNT